MADTPVYLVANLEIEDAATYLNYETGFFPLLKKHGGRFVTYDDKPQTLEGEAPRSGRIVLFSFPSEAQAHAWYEDPDYQALAAHRRKGARLQFLTLVHGMPPR